MSFRQLDLCSADELLQKLQSKLQDKSSQFQDIFDRWSELRENPPAKPDGYFFQLLAEEVVKVVSSLDGDFELIRNFSAIIPSTHCVTCYPDATGRVQYFTLLSDARYGGLRGEIYSTSVDNSDGEAETFHLEDLDFMVNDSNAWKEVVDQSRKEGWLRCLLDLLSWKLEYRKIEYGACGTYLRRKQIEIAKELGALPFQLHADSDKLSIEMKQCTEENSLGPKGKLSNVPVWVHYFYKERMGSDDEKENALQEVLDRHNLRCPNLITWSLVDSGSPDKWALVTPILTQTLSATLEFNQGNDQFKLDAIRDIASGLDYLYRKETWHGNLRSTNVLVSSASSPRDRCFVLSGFVPLTRAGPSKDAYRIRNTKGELISQGALDDVKSFGRIIYELYPGELAFDSEALEKSYSEKSYNIEPDEATPDDLAVYLIANSIVRPEFFPCSRIGKYIHKTCAILASKNADMDSEHLAAPTTLSNATSQQEVQPGDLPASSVESSSGSAATSQTLVEPPSCDTPSKVPSAEAQPPAPPFRSASELIKEKRMSRKPPSPLPVSSEKPKSKGLSSLLRKFGLKGSKGH